MEIRMAGDMASTIETLSLYSDYGYMNGIWTKVQGALAYGPKY